jgi:hypothetical protein
MGRLLVRIALSIAVVFVAGQRVYPDQIYDVNLAGVTGNNLSASLTGTITLSNAPGASFTPISTSDIAAVALTYQDSNGFIYGFNSIAVASVNGVYADNSDILLVHIPGSATGSLNPISGPTTPDTFDLEGGDSGMAVFVNNDTNNPHTEFTSPFPDFGANAFLFAAAPGFQPTPEPASMTLVASGFFAAGGFGLVRRRRAATAS